MNATDQPPAHVRWTRSLEEATSLDKPVHALEPHIRKLFGSGTRGAVLRGDWLGHALHPVLTDVVIGTWTSATLLDLFGGRDSSQQAQRLVGMGLLVVAPTAWAGWAEWSTTELREKRVGLVHAAVNGAVIGLYAASWAVRRRGQHGAGARLALAGAAASGLGAYLGGHLATARKVGTHHAAFDEASQQV